MPVYLFCPFSSQRGRPATFEPLLAQRAVERVVGLYVDAGLRDLAYGAYYADEADPAEIVSVAETAPFLTEHRVLVVNGAERYQSEASAPALLRYLARPCETTVLLLVASQIDRRSKFYKACEKAGQVVECPELKEAEVRIWARSEIEAKGKTIDAAALRELVDRTGTRLSDVSNAVELLGHYVGNAAGISEADVIAACADVAEEVVWALTDAIASSDTGKAVRVLREILDLGKNEFEILGTLNWLLKTAYYVLHPGPTPLKPFVEQKVRPLAKKLGKGKIRDAFSLCMETEILLRTTGVDRALVLELLVVKLAAPRAGAPAPV